MNISRFSVNRPVFTSMVTMIVIILGFVSVTRLPVDLMPDITYPTISVVTTYANASPEEMEELVTRLIEEAMSAVPGVEEVSSASSEGQSNVRVTFTWGTDLDEATNDIRDRLDRVISRLPDDADRPLLRKFDLASFPILILGASSRLDPVQMRRIIDEQVKYRLERVPGVASLDIWGGLEREIQVLIDRDKLKAVELSLDQLIARVRAANTMLPAGTIDSGNYSLTVRTPGEFTDLDELRSTIIATRAGEPVHLREVAEVKDAWERITRIVRVDGEPGIRLSISKQSGTNTVEVARRALQEIAQINRDIPQLRITPIIDTSEYIQRSISNVGRAALYGGLYGVIVLLIFLRSVRSTIVVAVTIPVSIIATFTMIYFGGFTLNLMTLGGLALGVGMLVDNAIVVLENIFRLREEGMSGQEAAITGAEEVGSAIVASTMTTLVVFLPLIFVRGMAGVMFKQLAYVISFALICALGAALTLIPMLAARILRTPGSDNKGKGLGMRIFKITGRFFTWLENSYRDALHTCLNHRFLVVLGAVVILGCSFLLAPLIGVELMPQSDEGEVRVELEMEVGSRIDITDQAMLPVEEIIRREVPELQSMVSSIGGSPWRGASSHLGQIRIALVPLAERQRSHEEIAAHLRRALNAIPGATVRVRPGQGLFILRRVSGGTERIEVEVRGFEIETADALAQQVRQLIEEVDGVTDVVVGRDSGAPERLIQIDRRKAETMKVSVRQIAEMLQTVVSGSRAGYFRDDGNEYTIRVMLKDAERQALRDILDLTVTNADGQPVVLRNLATVQERTGPVRIDRKNQERIVTVRANIADRDMGSIIADIQAALPRIPVPRGFSVILSGDYEEQQKAFRELGLGLFLALILVYMVMACLYESLRDPFVVMFSVPMAIIGVLLMLFLTRTTFNMQSYIGCIMLGGIVVNNAILLVDTTNLLRRRDGMELRTAIEEAGRRRLRPILMTALTTIFGLLPLAIGMGEGGEAQAPMARAVIGGLFSSTLITLIFVPVVYSLAESFHKRTKNDKIADSANPEDREQS